MSDGPLLVTGSSGLLGFKLVAATRGRVPVVSAGRRPGPGDAAGTFHFMDVTDRASVLAVVRSVAPTAIIHTAAMTAVDRCEAEPEAAAAVNTSGAGHVAAAAAAAGAHLVVLSTDYVFDGEAGPYREEDPVRPLSVYGRSKLAGERAAAAACPDLCVARTSVLYGVAPGVRPSFVSWLVNELSAGRPVTVVDDQTGSPTLADDLALLLLDLSTQRATGVFHTAGPEWLSRYDFALRIAATFDLDAGLIRRGATAALRQPAARPRHSGLVVAKLVAATGRTPAGIDAGLATVRRQMDLERRAEPR